MEGEVGMLQVYTGNGKGKTTAAVGLAVRAIGAGLRVYMMQFMKGKAYSEQSVLQGMGSKLRLRMTGKPFFIAEQGKLDETSRAALGDEVVVFPPGKPPVEYVRLLAGGLEQMEQELQAETADLILLDEINVALFFRLIAREQLETFLDRWLPGREIVCTGRNAPEWLLQRADLVTEMAEVKHYYTKGVSARKGIEC